MKKCLIVCWYGKLPKYYKLWEKSCENNLDYDFLIFTDQILNSNTPNIKIINISISEIKNKIEKKLNIKTNFTKPYKLCDFRPAYGIIFEEYLKKYEYWGHCDIDMVFGKISNFIPDSTIMKFEKINSNGHFVLYKNTKKINKLFMKKGAVFEWKEVFSNPENYAFDEYTGINKIVEKNNISLYSSNNFADIDKKYKQYKTVNHRNWKNQVFILESGEINRYIFKKNIITKKDTFMYLHFQKKIPNIENNIRFTKKIVLGSAKFKNINIITDKSFHDFNPSANILKEKLELVGYYCSKTLELIKSPKEVKRIKRKQKIIS